MYDIHKQTIHIHSVKCMNFFTASIDTGYHLPEHKDLKHVFTDLCDYAVTYM